MRYGSVCSGIEAATTAWHPLGWSPAWFAEIDKFPSQVLAHHYPNIPNLGDMTRIKFNERSNIDVLVGGTPCQSFSVAGLRKGLADPRGNLALVYLGLVDKLRPRWVVWENVPGVLSSHGGRDFGAFLGALGQLGYGWAYRVLDAQYFGLAQRRKRVFVVGHTGGWQYPAAVLFERESLSGHPAPSRKKGQGFTADIAPSSTASGRGVASTGETRGQDPVVAWPADVTATLGAAFGSKHRLDDQHALGGGSLFVPDSIGTITARMFNALGARDVEEGAIIAFPSNMSGTQRAATENRSPTLRAGDPPAAAFGIPGNWIGRKPKNGGNSSVARTVGFTEEGSPPLRASASGTNQVPTVMQGAASNYSQVRRLTPTECERLQGFPDGYTDIKPGGKPTPDGPRYKALGNSMAVPVMRWIGERIQAVENL